MRGLLDSVSIPTPQAVRSGRDLMGSGSSKLAYVQRLKQLLGLLGHDSDGVKSMALREIEDILSRHANEVGGVAAMLCFFVAVAR